MNETKPNSRVSFAKDKISPFPVGSSGITGTSDSSRNPISEAEGTYYEGGSTFNSSDLLFRNIDKLGAGLLENNNDHYEHSEPKQEDFTEESIEGLWENDLLDNMSEAEVIMNLDQHLNGDLEGKREVKRINASAFSPDPTVTYTSSQNKTITNFCTNCGRAFSQNDNFCGVCGNKRN